MKQINSLKEITSKNYILKIGANWCSPCKMEDSILDSDSINNIINVKDIDIYKIDIDNEVFDDFIEEQQISSIPVLIYFKDCKEVQKSTNLQTEQQILNDINKLY